MIKYKSSLSLSVFLFLLLHCSFALAQEKEWEGRGDSKPEVFTDYFSAKFLLDIYAFLTADTTRVSNFEPRESIFATGYYGPRVMKVTESYTMVSTEENIAAWGAPVDNMYNWDIDNPHFPKRISKELRRSHREYRRKYRKQIPDERRRLVLYLHALSAEEERPLVFTDIWRDYGGDIERYVDDIYDRSILINHKRMTNFCNYPRVKTFVSDPGVRFVVSMELFRNAQKLKELQATVDSVK